MKQGFRITTDFTQLAFCWSIDFARWGCIKIFVVDNLHMMLFLQYDMTK
jgi:hypothetical protein